MTLVQLETFFWVVSLGSFGAAAERLHATQSTISMRIRELERNLGTELFDRTQRSARLTPKGHELMEYAARLLDLAAEIQNRMAAPESLAGYVRLGLAEVISITWLPRLVKEISQCYPLVRLEIDQELTEDLMDGLKNGQLDLVMAPGHVPTPNVCAASLGSVQFAWMASPSLGIDKPHYTAAQLAVWPVIGLTSKSFHHSGIEEWFRRDNARCRYQARCKSIAVAASMAMAGLGVSYLPIRCFQDAIDDSRLQIIPTDPIPPVEFITATAIGDFHPLAARVAAIAEKVTDFERVGPQPPFDDLAAPLSTLEKRIMP